MKERVTFIHQQGAEADPRLFQVRESGFFGPTINSTLEYRATFPLSQLPTEIKDILHLFQDVQIKWTSSLPYTSIDPFTSRAAPGFHLTLISSRRLPQDLTELCSQLQIFGSIECFSFETFTVTPTGYKTSETAYYLYQELDTLVDFAQTLSQSYCPSSDSACRSRIQSLESASTLDLSFDAASKSARVRALWPLAERGVHVSSRPESRTEVGIMGLDVPPNIEPHEVGVSGTLTVIGEQKEPSPVLFAFPSRHRMLNTSFSANFLSPSGLHPTLRVAMDSIQTPPQGEVCRPYVYLTLPKTLFTDRYQLADDLFLLSQNLTASPYTSLPVDLEAPAYTTKIWGSNVLLELARPPTPTETESWTFEVPLHIRYLKPSISNARKINAPYPVVFWACELDAEVNFSSSPFDRSQLGYDALFPSNTVFWHVSPHPQIGDVLKTTISVPVLEETTSPIVALGTPLAIALGFGWILWKLFSGNLNYGCRGTFEPPMIKRKDAL